MWGVLVRFPRGMSGLEDGKLGAVCRGKGVGGGTSTGRGRFLRVFFGGDILIETIV